MLSDDFSDEMDTTITIYPYSSQDKYGKPLYGTSFTTDAIYIEKIIGNKEKNEVISSDSRLFIDGDISISKNDKIVVNGIYPKIKDIKTVRQDGEPYSKIIYL